MSHYRGVRQDVKARTMRFVALDPDIASKYDELDEEDNSSRLLRFRPPRDVHRGGVPKKMINMIERHIITRRDQNVMRTTGAGTSSSRRDFIYLVTVKNASRSGKDHVFKLLSNSVAHFMPISPRMQEHGDLSFYVSEEDDAQAICLMSKRIADKYNPTHKYMIYSKRVPTTFETISFSNRQIIEQVVKERFKEQTNSLDLSSFQNDPSFERNHLSYGLIHNHVVVAVANFVARNFPSIRGIRLNNNNLRTLDFVSCLVYAAPNVVELDLANNAISRVTELAKLKNWALESVHFENNEFVASFQCNFVTYANAIHQYFPRVTYLDGRSIQPSAEGGIADASLAEVIPRFRSAYPSNESLRTLTEKFLLEFYNFYDGPKGEQTRQQLLNAYDTNATFTYSMCFLSDSHQNGNKDRSDHQELVGMYIRSSHNIIKQHKWQLYRDKIIYRGPMDIAVALSKLPPTEHIKQSFLLDFNFVTNNLMVVLLQGIFRDGKEVLEGSAGFVNVKFFTRQLAIIPKAEGLAIISDILQITPVSTARMERYNNLLKSATVAQSQSPVLVQGGTLASAVQQQIDGMAPPPPSPQTQQDALLPSTSSALMVKMEPQPVISVHDRESMVAQFCSFSGMKPAWSAKCLYDCKWNWELAVLHFSQLKAAVPPEAFA
ncbi:hypothetical protein GPALN_005492 [Globodera pallida]|nr:hypothetical protein GPALN_005492 [Globodera pallida]